MKQIVLIVFLGALTPACGLGMVSCFNTYTAYENTGLTMECQWRPDKAHSWTLDNRVIATCGADSTSCTQRDTGVVSDSSLQVGSWNPGVSSSTMSVPEGQERAIAGYVQCESDEAASGCSVRVVHITEATCSIYIQKGLWTVQIVCEITKMYDSDGRYSCKLPARPGLKWQPSNSRAAGNLTLHSYMENNKEYKRGTCVFNFLAMPTSKGSHQGGVEFVPSTEHGFVKTPALFIAPPTGTPIFVDCPIFINEGDDLTCTCQPSPSFPEAVTSWKVNTTGQAAHVLSVRNVSKADIDRGFQCEQCWSQNKTFLQHRTYRPEVGGKNVTHCSQTWDFSGETWTVTFVCNVERMYSSGGRYICKWIYPAHWEKSPSYVVGVLSLVDTTIDGKVFQEGTCVLRDEKPILTTDGQQNYSLQFVPGEKPTGPDQFSALALDIRQPGPPTLLDCPEVVNASAINCTCQPSKGTPPAVVTWTESTGSNSGLLQIKNIDRSMDGHTYNCTQFWGGLSENFQKTVNYTLRLPEEATTLPPITKEEITVVAGVGAGFAGVWGTLAAMGQVCQVLSNAGWMPFLHFGSDDKTDEEKKFEHSEDSSDAGPPSKLFIFCNIMCCGGAGVLKHLFLYCISCGKRYTKKKKKKVVQDDADPPGMSDEQVPVPLTPTAVVVDIPMGDSVDSVDSEPSGSHDAHLLEPPSLTSPASQEKSLDTSVDLPEKAAFTDRYFAVARWLENPAKEKKISHGSTATTLRAFHSTGLKKKKTDSWTRALSKVTDGSRSGVHTQEAEYAPDDDAEESHQKANNILISESSQTLSVPNPYASGTHASSGSHELSFD